MKLLKLLLLLLPSTLANQNRSDVRAGGHFHAAGELLRAIARPTSAFLEDNSIPVTLAASALSWAIEAAEPEALTRHATPRSDTARNVAVSLGDAERVSASRHPDFLGIFLGVAIAGLSSCGIVRGRRRDEIASLFETNVPLRELEEKAARGEPLPRLVVVRGTIEADGRDVAAVSPQIRGLRERVGEISQPKNAWVEIARQAQSNPNLRAIASTIAERTRAAIPDALVRWTAAGTRPPSQSLASERLVLSEILIGRICAKHQRRIEDRKSSKVVIKRPCRNESYNCFHGRRCSEGLHVIDMEGRRADLELPPPDAVRVEGIAEPPPLFLPVDDVWAELTRCLRKESAPGQRHPLTNLPPIRLSDPYTLLSDFIFLDAQSFGDVGTLPGHPEVLSTIAEAFRTQSGPAKFLWEPRGFYDSVKGGGYNDVPAYANPKYRRAEMVSASEFIERAEVAATENTRSTPYCEPSFTRAELEERRNQENCIRYTELAIPRGSPITILARPTITQAGTGEGADCRIRLMTPQQDSDDDRVYKSLADRPCFRILRGHGSENLLRHRDAYCSVKIYYCLTVLGALFAIWAALGYRPSRL